GTTLYRGVSYRRIVNADIVTNDGMDCYLQDSVGGKKAEQVFAHELGHTLGIGHSCGDLSSSPCSNATLDQALMRAIAHNDGRGAALNSDDRSAAFYLYGVPTPKDFFTLAPCRLLDTREPEGGPVLQAQQPRTFSAAGRCGIPSTAVALLVNVTAVAPSSGGYFTLYPARSPRPDTSTLNFAAGRTRSNHSLLSLSRAPEPAFTVFAGMPLDQTVHLIVDVNGYFE
ncbi:MAG: reprolysin-like metallopeptidase, partial [Thermoanaerobaculia bacterium]